MTVFSSRLILAIVLVAASANPALAARNGDKFMGWPGQTLAGAKCEGGKQGFGPFDYTDPTYTVKGLYTRHGRNQAPIRTVERVHFTNQVEQLIRGHTSVDPIGDIDYTLRAFPNHHRALFAYVRYYLRELPRDSRDRPVNEFSPSIKGYSPPECYFQRANYFAPEDGMVSALFGLYLHRRNQLDAALAQYEAAEKRLGPNAELYYNRGLLHFDRGEYEEAQEYADKAYNMNYQLPGLRRKLQNLKKQ